MDFRVGSGILFWLILVRLIIKSWYNHCRLKGTWIRLCGFCSYSECASTFCTDRLCSTLGFFFSERKSASGLQGCRCPVTFSSGLSVVSDCWKVWIFIFWFWTELYVVYITNQVTTLRINEAFFSDSEVHAWLKGERAINSISKYSLSKIKVSLAKHCKNNTAFEFTQLWIWIWT